MSTMKIFVRRWGHESYRVKIFINMACAGLILSGVLLGCARPRTQVILLPDPSGHVGSIDVRNAAGTQKLEQPYHSVSVMDSATLPAKPELLQEADIKARFGAAMNARPEEPKLFVLQFESGAATLTEDSRALVKDIMHTIKERASLDVSVVGHTDTAGSAELNNQLARQRAEVVAKLLRETGADSRIFEITSHGKSMPIVPTGDNVPEPKNRRVEVTVR